MGEPTCEVIDMLTIEALNAYGANTRAGIARCMNDEPFYLGLIEMLINDEKFEYLDRAIKQRNLEMGLILACALAETASSLGLRPLAEQIEKMILCLQLKGDSAVLDKQLKQIKHWYLKLRDIDIA